MRAAPVVTDTAVEALLVAEIHLAAAVLAVVAQVQIGKTVEEYSSAVFSRIMFRKVLNANKESDS